MVKFIVTSADLHIKFYVNFRELIP